MKAKRNSVPAGQFDETIRIVDTAIKPDLFNEFFEYIEEKEDQATIKAHDSKKSELAALAKSGTIESLREIERMIETHGIPDEYLVFANAALNYCRFLIENDMFDLDVDMISGGLGGADNKLRYYLALTGRETLTDEHCREVEQVFRSVSGSYDSLIEEVSNNGFYVSLLILGSVDYAVGNFLDEAISGCNFLEKDYYLTNVEIPTSERIRDWLDGKLDETTN